MSVFTIFSLLLLRPPISTLFPYTTLFRSLKCLVGLNVDRDVDVALLDHQRLRARLRDVADHHAVQLGGPAPVGDRKSTRLNSSHPSISYAVFCLKKKNQTLPYRDSRSYRW